MKTKTMTTIETETEKYLQYPAATLQTSLPGAVVTGPGATYNPSLLCCFCEAILILENLKNEILKLLN